MCRADWKSRQVRDGHDKDGCHLRGKRIVNIDLADIHPHSFDHVISAGYGANSQGDRTSENEPQRNYDVSGIKTGKSDGDETHDLLRVVAAITEGEKKAAQLMKDHYPLVPNDGGILQQTILQFKKEITEEKADQRGNQHRQDDFDKNGIPFYICKTIGGNAASNHRPDHRM